MQVVHPHVHMLTHACSTYAGDAPTCTYAHTCLHYMHVYNVKEANIFQSCSCVRLYRFIEE